MSKANLDNAYNADDLKFAVLWHGIHTLDVAFSATATTLADITGTADSLKHWLSTASGVYEFEAVLFSSSPDTAGIEYGINGPASASVFATAFGSTTTTAAAGVNLQALNTKTSVAFNALNGQGYTLIQGYMTLGATPGYLTIQADKKTSGTGTIAIGSQLRVRRIA